MTELIPKLPEEEFGLAAEEVDEWGQQMGGQ